MGEGGEERACFHFEEARARSFFRFPAVARPVNVNPTPEHHRQLTMINAVLVFNNAGQPRLTKFYTQLVGFPLHIPTAR